MTDSLYIVGLGTNVAPERNIVLALEALLARFGEVHVSRIARTQPVGMRDTNPFLNGAVAIRGDLDARELKDWFNHLEVAQGRDRMAPDRKTRPRPLDLDILRHLAATAPPPAPEDLPSEPYARPFVEDLLAHLGLGPDPRWDGPLPCVSLSVAGHRLGQRPVTLRASESRGTLPS